MRKLKIKLKKYIIIIHLLLLTGIIINLSGQDYLYDIQYITTKDGLAHSMTSALHQDQKKFLWIGTRFGLNRYDGDTFKHFSKDKNGLKTDNVIVSIIEDNRGNFWHLSKNKKSIGHAFV